jgi:hypothetical protein
MGDAQGLYSRDNGGGARASALRAWSRASSTRLPAPAARQSDSGRIAGIH